jgi:hypothetical protein
MPAAFRSGAVRYVAKVLLPFALLILLASPVRVALAAPPPIVQLVERITDFSGKLSADA